MDMFTREEAFAFVKTKLEVKDAEERMETDRRALLDEIIAVIHGRIPFQNLGLLSVPSEERRQPTMQEIKSDFLSGFGGLCFNMNTSGFFLFKALGFDIAMGHTTCTTSIRFHRNHVTLYVSNLEKPGDKFLVELGLGMPTFEAIDLDFETESPIYHSSYLEYKYVRHDGKILRMHRKGDQLANRSRVQNPDLDFWIGDFRRFYEAELETTTDFDEFSKYNREIYVNPKASPFHTSHRFIIYTGRKTFMVINGKTLNENENGDLESKEIPGGDDGIVATIRQLCSSISEDVIRKSLHHWKLTLPPPKS